MRVRCTNCGAVSPEFTLDEVLVSPATGVVVEPEGLTDTSTGYRDAEGYELGVCPSCARTVDHSKLRRQFDGMKEEMIAHRGDDV